MVLEGDAKELRRILDFLEGHHPAVAAEGVLSPAKKKRKGWKMSGWGKRRISEGMKKAWGRLTPEQKKAWIEKTTAARRRYAQIAKEARRGA